jgi:hypothetical protein
MVMLDSESQLILFQALKSVSLTILVLWTIAANALVFVVLYKNPRLQTVPNLLVGFCTANKNVRFTHEHAKHNLGDFVGADCPKSFDVSAVFPFQ